MPLTSILPEKLENKWVQNCIGSVILNNHQTK
jgi:hypothetical protein